MANEANGREFEILEVIPLHFDVPGHHLPLREFIETASKAQAIVDSFNAELFDGKFRYEFVVLPPTAGTFTNRLGIYLKRAGWTGAVFGVIGAGLESDMGQAFVKGLTGHEPAHWTEQAGVAVRKAFSEDDVEIEEKIRHQCAALVLSESTTGFLGKDLGELTEIGVSKSKFRDAYQARNDFYEACVRNPSIKGLGFDDSDRFPIDRKAFDSLIVSLPPEPEEEPIPDWIVETTFIKVTSPNWNHEDLRRGWKGKDRDGYDVYFSVEDEAFWAQAEIDQLHLHTIDQMKVQWAFIEEGKRRKSVRVLRVLEFNGEKISEPIPDDKLPQILLAFEVREDDQHDLFET